MDFGLWNFVGEFNNPNSFCHYSESLSKYVNTNMDSYWFLLMWLQFIKYIKHNEEYKD